jgi:hypothetical protein
MLLRSAGQRRSVWKLGVHVQRKIIRVHYIADHASLPNYWGPDSGPSRIDSYMLREIAKIVLSL